MSLVHHSQQLSIDIGMDIVIGINKTQIFTRSRIKSCISSSSQSLILMRQHFDVLMTRCILLGKFQTIVRTAIIDQDDLIIIFRQILIQQRIHALGQILRRIIHRCYNTQLHLRCFSHSYVILIPSSNLTKAYAPIYERSSVVSNSKRETSNLEASLYSHENDGIICLISPRI